MHVPSLLLPFLPLTLLISTTAAAPPSAETRSHTASLLAAAKCPNFRHTNPNQYLGPDKAAHCNWKQALNCTGFLVGCGVPCLASATEALVNPFLVAACAGCVGVTAAHCAECWDGHGGQKGICRAVRKDPHATCLEPACVDSKKEAPPPKGTGDGLTVT